MGNISDAKRILNHYFRKAWEAGGLYWDSDNEAEVNAIVDEMVTGIKKELHMEKTDRYGSDEGYQPIFYGPNAQIRKEMPEKFMEEVDRYDRTNHFPTKYDEMDMER
ncbi:MAG: hypothetical protein NC240_06515 [Clostridium sp.]|nr:hypothetical protein [Clostridium sp.]